MRRLAIGIVIGIGALGFGCGKGKTVGPEVCPLVAAKVKLCHDVFWARVVDESQYGPGYRKDYDGKEQKWCEEKFKMGLADGEVFDSCIKTEDCKAWSECVYPKGFFGGGNK